MTLITGWKLQIARGLGELERARPELIQSRTRPAPTVT